MPAVALLRAGARVVESGPDGENLAAGAWQRLEALPDPRSRGGGLPAGLPGRDRGVRVTAAGNDRLLRSGSGLKGASQADLARLRAPWDPMAGRYRAPDEKTIRVVLDKLDPRALTRALLGPGRAAALAGCPRPACAATGPGAPSRRRKHWPAAGYGLWPWTARPPGGRAVPTAPGTHLLGAAEHGGALLGHLEVDVKHNETSHFTALLEPLDLAGAVVTFDALHTVRANLDWLTGQKKAHYIAVIKRNQPLLHARVKTLPWRQVPAAASPATPDTAAPRPAPSRPRTWAGLDLPGARQAIKITRWRQVTATSKVSRQSVYAITSLTAPRPHRATWPGSCASTGPSRRTITCGT